MRSTAELRRIWGPECATTRQLVRISLHNGVKITVRRECEEAYRALDAVLKKHNYRPRQADTAAMNCRTITGGSGLSLHSFGIAVDINWQSNGYGKRATTDMPPAMISDIEAIRTKGGHRVWSWGGRWSTPDFMHQEVVASPAELATGIAGETPPKKEEDIMASKDELRDVVREALAGVHARLDDMELRQQQDKNRGDKILAGLREQFPEAFPPA